MTNELLEQYMRMYNAGSWDIPFHSVRIGSNVVFAKIRPKSPPGTVAFESYNFYFIEHQGKCVAIVHEMDTYDIHSLVIERMRKKGYLHNALNNTILPHIFLDGRTEQRATAKTEENRAYLERQGFEKRTENGERVYYLSADKVKRFDRNAVQLTFLTDNEINQVNHQLLNESSSLQIIKDKLLCSCGDDFHIEDIIYELNDIRHIINDRCKEYNRSPMVRPITSDKHDLT